MEYKSQNVICQNCSSNFTIEPDDFGFYDKIQVPPPTFCPECRRQRRLVWRNNFSLYNRTCDLCQKPVITIYSKESKIIIYCNKCWWSDKWDPFKYGQDYDFSRNFFEQFKELSLKVPHMALINDNNIASVNCEYTQDLAFSKNCYMTFVAWYIENVMYSYFILAGKDMMDCMNIRSKNEWLYECILARNNYRLKYSQVCMNCIDSVFLYDCINCQDCLLCAGLRNKRYCYKNEQYSKEEYDKILSSYSLDTFSGVEKAQKEFDEFIIKSPRRYVFSVRTLNSRGDIISDSKNVKDCFVTKNSENCRFCDFIADVKDCYDQSNGGELSEGYENVTCDNSSRSMFGIYSWKSQDTKYTAHCHSSKYLLGCVGLRNTSYSILNKRYSKEEFEEISKKILEQMKTMPYVDKKGNSYYFGEFFPAELSPFGYNETEADDYFPLKKEEINNRGFMWQDNIQRTIGKESIKTEDIPDSISKVEDSILGEVLACLECRRNYKIVENELIFYRKMGIPIPRRCFYCRQERRRKRCNPFKLWHRRCMCDRNHPHHDKVKPCPVEFETSYAPDRPEIVYCEKCYQQEVY